MAKKKKATGSPDILLQDESTVVTSKDVPVEFIIKPVPDAEITIDNLSNYNEASQNFLKKHKLR